MYLHFLLDTLVLISPLIVQMKLIQNQPYDESLEVSDGEEIASNNPTPRASTIVHSNVNGKRVFNTTVSHYNTTSCEVRYG